QEAVQDIARELGVQIEGERLLDALLAIRAGLLRVKSPGDVAGSSGETALAKGDSLADAVRHGREIEHQLRDDLTTARTALNRIAAAMQLPDWDRTATPILERIQKYEVVKHAIRQRIIALRGRTDYNLPSATIAMIERELRLILCLLIGDSATERLLAKLPIAASSTLVTASEGGKHQPTVKFPLLVTGDLVLVREALDHFQSAYGAERDRDRVNVLY